MLIMDTTPKLSTVRVVSFYGKKDKKAVPFATPNVLVTNLFIRNHTYYWYNLLTSVDLIDPHCPLLTHSNPIDPNGSL